jgi:hypothetical protein
MTRLVGSEMCIRDRSWDAVPVSERDALLAKLRGELA